MNDILICKYNPNQIDKYTWAVCSCIPSLYYGIRIKRKKENFWADIECPRCGNKIGIFVTKES